MVTASTRFVMEEKLLEELHWKFGCRGGLIQAEKAVAGSHWGLPCPGPGPCCRSLSRPRLEGAFLASAFNSAPQDNEIRTLCS